MIPLCSLLQIDDGQRYDFFSTLSLLILETLTCNKKNDKRKKKKGGGGIKMTNI